jgi:K+-transporting ATPase ATPase C chain
MVLIRQTLVLFTALTALTGIVYPLAITGVAQLLFPREANGSIIEVGGKPIGSELIGQPFHDP